jgi:RsiW-degrading membrane proteinase PrsW (M82 family)
MLGNQIGRRNNAFEKPWHALQVLTWIIYPLVLLHYYVFLMNLLWDILVVKVIITILFSFFSLASLYTVHKTCSINPVDDGVNNRYLHN